MPERARASLYSPLPTPAEMAAWDKASIERYGIPEFTLMENASREAFHVLHPLLAPGSRVLVLIGRGNNGGDGAAVARHLLDSGHAVLVCHAHPLEKLTGVAAEHAALAARTGVPFVPATLRDGVLDVPEPWRDIAGIPHMLIDALLGTGFSGELREREQELVRHINALRERAFVVALDIPSGLDGLTGAARPDAVRARLTVTFAAAKIGLCLPQAAPYTGELHVRPIGIPRQICDELPPSFRLLDPQGPLFPPPAAGMHKGDAGRVLIIGGSPEFIGAPQLAALGALRAGAGLVSVACPADLAGQIRGAWPEIMALPLGAGCAWTEDMIAPLLAFVSTLPEKSALVLGPGLGRSPAAALLVRAVLGMEKRPALVLDADGLFPLAPDSDMAALLRAEDCITPHPGEAAHMLGMDTAAVQTDRPAAARALARRGKATVVLKGAGSLVCRHDEPVTLAPFAAPSLAVGGSGDVLAGVVAALLARGCEGAACLGVYLHGRAGELLARRYPRRGVLAREIADAVPLAAAEQEREKSLPIKS